MYICKYMKYIKDPLGGFAWECPFKEELVDQNARLGEKIVKQICPEDVKRNANGSPICYEWENDTK